MKNILDSKFETDRLSYFKSISNLSLDDLNNKSYISMYLGYEISLPAESHKSPRCPAWSLPHA